MDEHLRICYHFLQIIFNIMQEVFFLNPFPILFSPVIRVHIFINLFHIDFYLSVSEQLLEEALVYILFADLVKLFAELPVNAGWLLFSSSQMINH